MYLVDLLFGESVAKGIGSGLLIDWPWTETTRPAYVTDIGSDSSGPLVEPDQP
jgi:hypothetical protein